MAVCDFMRGDWAEPGGGSLGSSAHVWNELSSDAELITAARAGDSAAFGTLYERHSPAARAVARQYTRSTADAEDILSDAFTRVFAVVRDGGGPDVAFRAYLFTVVRRLAYAGAQGGRRVQPTDDMAVFETAFGAEGSVEDPALAGFERGVVAKAYASLPERWQAALWYTEVERLSAAQIAPLLGLTANGVAALAYRAREGLRQAYLQQHLAAPPRDGCRSVNDKLGAYVRGGLARRETSQVEGHLDECVECRALVLELGDVNFGMRVVIAPLILGVAGLAALAHPLPVGGLVGIGAGLMAGSGGAGGAGVAVGSSAAAGTGLAGGAGVGAGTGVATGTGIAGGAGVAGGAGASVGIGASAGFAGGAGIGAGTAAGTAAAAAGTAAGTVVGTAGGTTAVMAGTVAGATAAAAATAGGTVVAAVATGGVAAFMAAIPVGVVGAVAAGLVVASLAVAGVTGGLADVAAGQVDTSSSSPDDQAAPATDAPAATGDAVIPDVEAVPGTDGAVVDNGAGWTDGSMIVFATDAGAVATDPTTPPAPTPAELYASPRDGGVTLIAGTDGLLSFDIANTGQATARDLRAEIALPTGVEYLGVQTDLVGVGGAGFAAPSALLTLPWACAPAEGSPAVICTAAELPGLSTAGLVLQVRVAEEVEASDVNLSLSVVSDGTQTHLISTAPVGPAPARIAIDPMADAALTVGEAATVTLPVRNAGALDASAVRVDVTLPEGVEWTGTESGVWTCFEASDPRQLECSAGVVAPRSSVPLPLSLRADERALVDPLPHLAISGTHEGAVAPVQRDIAVRVSPAPAEFAVSAPDRVTTVVGESTPVVIGIANVGGTDAADVVVQVAVPAGVTLSGADCQAGVDFAGATCWFGVLSAGLGVHSVTLDLVADESVSGDTAADVKVTVTGTGVRPLRVQVPLVVTEPTVHPSGSPNDDVTSPNDDVTRPVTTPPSAPVTGSASAPPPQPVTEPQSQPVTEPLTEPVADPVADPVVDPVADPVAVPVADSLTGPLLELLNDAADAASSTP